jgi:hypothetical protein
MSASRFTAAFASVGVLMAVCVNALWSLFEHSIYAGHYYLPIFKATLLLFPPSIGTMAISGASYWSSDHFALIGANGILYAIVGILVWLGLKRHRVFFVPVIAILVALIWAVVIVE